MLAVCQVDGLAKLLRIHAQEPESVWFGALDAPRLQRLDALLESLLWHFSINVQNRLGLLRLPSQERSSAAHGMSDAERDVCLADSSSSKKYRQPLLRQDGMQQHLARRELELRELRQADRVFPLRRGLFARFRGDKHLKSSLPLHDSD
nr:hypothetical protein [Bradyrhizobium sp. SZCCHNR1098]